MSTFAKIMVVVNFALAIAFLAAAGTLHGASESWKGRHDDVLKAKDREVSDLKAQITAKAGEVTQLNSQVANLEGRAQAAEAQQKQLNEANGMLNRQVEQQNAQISQLTAANQSASQAVLSGETRNAQLTADLARSEADRKTTTEANTTLTENLARETQRADTAEKSTAAAETTNKSLSEDNDRLNTELAGMRARFGAQPTAAVTKAVRGVVQAASPRDDVYILSVGSKDDVKPGYEFTVSRGDRYVSTIVIDKVFPDHAAGHTKPGMRKLDIEKGDSVATASGL